MNSYYYYTYFTPQTVDALSVLTVLVTVSIPFLIPLFETAHQNTIKNIKNNNINSFLEKVGASNFDIFARYSILVFLLSFFLALGLIIVGILSSLKLFIGGIILILVFIGRYTIIERKEIEKPVHERVYDYISKQNDQNIKESLDKVLSTDDKTLEENRVKFNDLLRVFLNKANIKTQSLFLQSATQHINKRDLYYNGKINLEYLITFSAVLFPNQANYSFRSYRQALLRSCSNDKSFFNTFIEFYLIYRNKDNLAQVSDVYNILDLGDYGKLSWSGAIRLDEISLDEEGKHNIKPFCKALVIYSKKHNLNLEYFLSNFFSSRINHSYLSFWLIYKLRYSSDGGHESLLKVMSEKSVQRYSVDNDGSIDKNTINFIKEYFEYDDSVDRKNLTNIMQNEISDPILKKFLQDMTS